MFGLFFFDANGMASNLRSVSSCCRPRPQQVAPRRNAKKCYQHFFIFFAPHNFPPKRRINASLFFFFTPSLITKYNDISDGVVEIKTTGRWVGIFRLSAKPRQNISSLKTGFAEPNLRIYQKCFSSSRKTLFQTHVGNPNSAHLHKSFWLKL